MNRNKCKDCGGDGTKQEKTAFKVKVPHGIPDGVTLKFAGRGNAGEKGGDFGSLFLTIEVKPHDKFERRGDDIYIEVEVEATTAVLGTTAKIPTVHGDKSLDIPSGTQPESILKMEGLGAPKFQGKGNGDQYVKVQVVIPKKISTEEKNLWERLKEIRN